ncbi:hypothetical protein GTZ97_06480 [Aquabacterium fontiphilum]|uniref:hypothetical protein n=1 Tax=Aquabacterium fontiphilum TaxID=450365 RepID=UPI001378BB54|nr:hypothetical protein [Aquabacterium fontiphilum]NBD20316.1 hypothetical protein [Aquabacterium fontiphilum]
MHSFADFWREIRQDYFRGLLKSLVYASIAVFVVIAVLLGGECLGLLSELGLKESACANLRQPAELLSRYLLGLPVFWMVLTALSTGVIYLEWDKYKKDKPSGFTHDKGCEGPPGYVRRLKEVEADSWVLEGRAWPLQPVVEGRYRCEGDYSEEALVKQIRSKFVRRENKPVTDTEHDTLWRIRQNSGTEVHVHLKRVAAEPGELHMQVQFFEWAGRRQPPVLAKDVVLEFKPLRS